MPIRALSVALLALAVAGCALSADDGVSAGIADDATLPDIGTVGSIDPVD